MEKLQTDHGTFTNNEAAGQTAKEVYQEWLNNKDEPLFPTLEQRLQQAEDTIMFLLMDGGV